MTTEATEILEKLPDDGRDLWTPRDFAHLLGISENAVTHHARRRKWEKNGGRYEWPYDVASRYFKGLLASVHSASKNNFKKSLGFQ